MKKADSIEDSRQRAFSFSFSDACKMVAARPEGTRQVASSPTNVFFLAEYTGGKVRSLSVESNSVSVDPNSSEVTLRLRRLAADLKW